MHRFELPFKAVHVQCLDDRGEPIEGAFASGFICAEAGMKFLYTCWHVVTGYNMHDVKIRNHLPARAALQITLQNSDTRAPGVTTIGGNQQAVLPLYQSRAIPFAPLWLQDEKDVPQPDLNAIGLQVPFWHDAIKLPLPETLNVADMQIIGEDRRFKSLVTPGDRIYVVGFPYGYSALGMQQPTPIVLTQHVAATRIAGRQREILLDGSGAPGMSGGPVFLENSLGISLLGMYTGLIYPDHVIAQNERVTALGTCIDMVLCWTHLPLKPYGSQGVDTK
jgi:hypothetical protein